MAAVSAGLLLHRRGPSGTEVLLGHMGGPFWSRRHEGAWTIPKGEPEPDETLLDTALREFAEELGVPAPDGETHPLGSVVQRGGKTVHAFARAADLDVTGLPAAGAATARVEWPPRSGRWLDVPELDVVRWWPLEEALPLVVTAQAGLLRLLTA